MASSKSSQKAARVAAKKRLRNRSTRSAIKAYITKAERLVSRGELETARGAVVKATSVLDKAAQKGVIHPNNAARRKSRLMKRLNQALRTGP